MDETGPDSAGGDATGNASARSFRRPVDSALGGWVLATLLQTGVVIYLVCLNAIIGEGRMARVGLPALLSLSWLIVLLLCWQLMRRIKNRWLAFGATAMVGWAAVGLLLWR